MVQQRLSERDTKIRKHMEKVDNYFKYLCRCVYLCIYDKMILMNFMYKKLF